MATLFGTTTATGGTDFFDDGDVFGSRYTPSAGTLTGAQVPIGNSGFTSIKLGIYLANGAGTSPIGTFLGASDTATTTPVAGLYTFTFSTPITLTGADIYALLNPAGGRLNLDNTVTGAGYRGRSLGASAAFPSPWPSTGSDDTNANGIAVLGTGTVGASTIVSPLQLTSAFTYAAHRASSY